MLMKGMYVLNGTANNLKTLVLRVNTHLKNQRLGERSTEHDLELALQCGALNSQEQISTFFICLNGRML
jgi:hypothetical protein